MSLAFLGDCHRIRGDLPVSTLHFNVSGGNVLRAEEKHDVAVVLASRPVAPGTATLNADLRSLPWVKRHAEVVPAAFVAAEVLFLFDFLRGAGDSVTGDLEASEG